MRQAASLPAGSSGKWPVSCDLRNGPDPAGDRLGSAHGSRSANPDGRSATTSLGCMRVGRSEAGSEIVVGPKLGAGSAEGRGRRDRGSSGLAAVSRAAVLLRGARAVAGCDSSLARPGGRLAVRFSAGRGALTRAGVPGSRRFGSARVGLGSGRSASAPGSMLACCRRGRVGGSSRRVGAGARIDALASASGGATAAVRAGTCGAETGPAAGGESSVALGSGSGAGAMGSGEASVGGASAAVRYD
jgi:hypothetical protein